MKHNQALCCRGEKCHCGNDAYHKVGEEMIDGDPTLLSSVAGLPTIGRHTLTTYVCCECFRKIMGPVAESICREWGQRDGVGERNF